MKNPAITVITPVFNGERFIESCLQSVIDQQRSDAEHLIMDGGSTDGTMEIVKCYAERNARIRWFCEKDRGQSDAMNKGISAAGGEIIGFLNSDDFYEPDILTRILQIFKTLPPPSLVVGNCRILNDEGETTHINKPRRLSVTHILIGGPKNEFPFNPCAYFYHKSLHKKIGMYDTSDHSAMDLDFLLRAIQAAHVHYVDELWGNFRLIKGTKTFQAIENNELRANKIRVMDIYLRKLPWFKRHWIKAVRFVINTFHLHYYSRRLTDCLKDPGEFWAVILRRFGKTPR